MKRQYSLLIKPMMNISDPIAQINALVFFPNRERNQMVNKSRESISLFHPKFTSIILVLAVTTFFSPIRQNPHFLPRQECIGA
jgi:hypothetical protein